MHFIAASSYSTKVVAICKKQEFVIKDDIFNKQNACCYKVHA
jgi:hypothetical protein